MSDILDKLARDYEKKLDDNEKTINPVKKRLDGYKLAYNNLAKSLSTIEKLPE